jgi:hypothetical protein
MRDEEREPAEAALHGIESLRRQVRRQRSVFWFPCVIFGLIILGSAPLYWQTATGCPGSQTSCGGIVHINPWTLLLGSFAGSPALAPYWGQSVYWLIGLTIGFLAAGRYCRRVRQRVGIRVRMRPLLLGCLAFVIVELGLWAHEGFGFVPLIPFVSTYGTQVLAVVAVGLLALAISERDRWQIAYAVGFAFVAVISMATAVNGLFSEAGFGGPFQNGGWVLPNLILPGGYLVLGGAVFGCLAHRSQHPISSQASFRPPGGSLGTSSA